MPNIFVDFYGEKTQIEKLHEETLELADAIFRHLQLQTPESKTALISEMADVSNLIGQLAEHWNDGSVYAERHIKQQRQLKRMREGE